MANVLVEVELPEVVVDRFGGMDPLRREISQSMVLELVRRREIDPQRGAELLDVPLFEFVELMSAHGLPYYDFTEDEWHRELANASAMRRRLHGEGLSAAGFRFSAGLRQRVLQQAGEEDL